MTRKSLATTPVLEAKQKSSGQSIVNAPKPKRPSTRLWPWLSILLLTGLLLLSGVSYFTWNWLRNVPVMLNTNVVKPQTITLNVMRTVSYADLSLTMLSAEYANSFSDDFIHPGPAVVRLNVQISNKTNVSIAVVYYDVARLLVPKQQPIAPTNVQLAGTVQKGATVQGWIDFPVAAGTQLTSLKLRLGSIALNETLVMLPFSGPFDANQFVNHLYPQSLVIYYNFKGYVLVYHLMSVDVRYSYNGSEVKAGQQFYIFNWSVDNFNGSDVWPGFGFDYMRMVVNGNNLPPIDNTLPNIFKARSKGVGGRVVYTAVAGMKALTIAFMVQLAAGQNNYPVNL
ncbi:MAG TPA: hypothetical protein VNE38_13090 [Ktedonobacteraceae bacterium]|nr:hypothetical protein [Ktedonobacteraceae bacterium]